MDIDASIPTLQQSPLPYPKLERRDTASEGVVIPSRFVEPAGVVSNPGSRPGSGDSGRIGVGGGMTVDVSCWGGGRVERVERVRRGGGEGRFEGERSEQIVRHRRIPTNTTL